MSQLIYLRQRMKAIETIKKITHAMRLISMSCHSQLKNKEFLIKNYIATLTTLFGKIHSLTPDWTAHALNPDTPTAIDRHLVIIVGSQKGLCGNFNTSLFHLIENHANEAQLQTSSIIAVGKKAVDYSREIAPESIIATHEKFSITNLFDIAQELATHILRAQTPYTRVTFFSSYSHSFFVQKPHSTTLIPLSNCQVSTEQPPVEGYIWEQDPHKVLDHLIGQYLEARIQQLLFQSLQAEHAARFISMDSSTRNAKNLLETTRLAYNKLRQAKITKELTELSSNY